MHITIISYLVFVYLVLFGYKSVYVHALLIADYL